MIDLLPVPQDRFLCPCGGGAMQADGFWLPGMMPLARCRCGVCGKRWLHHLHVGFAGSSNLALEEATGAMHNTITLGWYAAELEAMWRSRDRPAPRVDVRGALDAQGRDVVLINTLDPTYGHNIARLFAVTSVKQLYPESAVIVIAARFTAWLVPESVDQIWVVDAPLRELHLANSTVDALTQELMRKASRLRYAPIFYGAPVRIEDFTKQKPFEAQSLADVLPARLTFNWREDRCWTYLSRALPPAEALDDQLRLATLLFQRLRREIPDLEIAVTGYGRHGRFPDWVEDLRITEQTDAAEREWVRRYARSHLVMGVHGSNMHLPCAHAAGSIEITPNWLWNNAFDTWEWVNHVPANIALGRYLKIPQSTSLSEMASIAFILIRRMQTQAVYHLMGSLSDPSDRERLMIHAFPAVSGGYPIAIEGADGKPL